MPFPIEVSMKSNANSLLQDLNFDCSIHFLRPRHSAGIIYLYLFIFMCVCVCVCVCVLNIATGQIVKVVMMANGGVNQLYSSIYSYQRSKDELISDVLL